MRALLWGKVVETKLRELETAIKANFDPNQPRLPPATLMVANGLMGAEVVAQAEEAVKIAEQALTDSRAAFCLLHLRPTGPAMTPRRFQRRDRRRPVGALASTRKLQDGSPERC
jgi:hypothetical protein